MIKILLEFPCGTVRADVDIPDHKPYFVPNAPHLRFRRRPAFLHQRDVHRDAVALHQSQVDRRWGFDVFHNDSVLWKVAIKPIIECVVESQSEIRVGSSIPDCLRRIAVQLVKVPPGGDRLECREVFVKHFLRQLFQPAVLEGTELVCAFEGHLRRAHGVIHGGLDDDALGVGHCRFKGDIMGDLDDIGIH